MSQPEIFTVVGSPPDQRPAPPDLFVNMVEVPAVETAEHVPGHDLEELRQFRETLAPEHRAADDGEAAALDPSFAERTSGEQALLATVADVGREAVDVAAVRRPEGKPVRRRWTGLSGDSNNEGTDQNDTVAGQERSVGGLPYNGIDRKAESAGINEAVQAKSRVLELVRCLEGQRKLGAEGHKRDTDLDKRATELSWTLGEGGYDVQTARELVEVASKLDRITKQVVGVDMPFDARVVESLPASYLRELYFTESRGGEDDLRLVLNSESGNLHESRAFQLRVLEKLYGEEVGGERWWSDPLVQRVEASFATESEMRIARLPEEPNPKDETEVGWYNLGLQEKVAKILLESGLKKDIVKEYLVIAPVRLQTECSGNTLSSAINPRTLRPELARMVSVVQRYGAETINELNHTFGMEGLVWKTDSELDVLVGLQRYDQKTIEYLQKGDVTVVFEDFRNNYNGASTSQAFDKATGRTIKFELRHPLDVYRGMIFLNKLGIKPSVFVHIGHGMPGLTQAGTTTKKDGTREIMNLVVDAPESDETEVVVGDYGDRVERDKDRTQIPIAETQFGRLVRDYMQPNRGEDSAPENIGKIQIVLLTCSGGALVWSKQKGRFARGKISSVADEVAKQLVGLDARVIASPHETMDVTDNQGRLMFVDYDTYIKTGEARPSMQVLIPTRKGLLGRKTVIRRESIGGESVRKDTYDQIA